MEILSVVATPSFSKLIDKGIDYAAAEIHSIRKVCEAVKNLSSVLKKLEQHFREAEKVESVDGNDGVDSWLEELKEAAYDAEDILDLFATKTEVLKWKKNDQVCNPIFASVADSVGGIFSKKETADAINDLFTKLDKIYEERDRFIKLNAPYSESCSKTRASIKETGHSVDPSEVVGRDDDKNKIIKALMTEHSDKVHVVPILGDGGVGKTTLARLVFDDIKIKHHFQLRIWVWATDFNLHRILSEIILCDDTKKNDDLVRLSQSLLETRASRFLSEKRVLLVLDDVWKPRHWNPLKGVLQHGADGSRVLVTSRVEGNIKMMHNFHNIEPLGKLTDIDSSELFWKIAYAGDAPMDLQVIGKEIIDKCKGLPLAITALAGSLRGKRDVKRWMEIAKNNFSRIETNYLDETYEILRVLKVSYDQLPSHLKPCFLLCSLFPKGHFFLKKDLIRIWMAEGYIPLDEDDEPEYLGDRYFDELCDKSLLLLLNIRGCATVTIHDLFYEMAIFISQGNCLQLKDAPLPRVHEKTRHISLLGKNIEPALELIRNTQKVRTILMPRAKLMNFGKVLDDLFRSQKYIRVLDLSSSSIDKLPDSVKELHLLRYLDLSETKIQMLPASICHLWNLQTLKLVNCFLLIELPKDLPKLTNLRYLDVNFTFCISGLPAGAGRLKNLQFLRDVRFLVGKEEGYRIEELGDLENLTGSLHLLRLENVVNAEGAKLGTKERLRCVVFEWSKKDECHVTFEENSDINILNGLKPHSNVQWLEIINFGGSDFPKWVKDGLLTKLTTISLDHCYNCKILSLGQPTVLESLSLNDMPELEMWNIEEGNDWSGLRILKIVRCPKLSNLPNAFTKLVTLEIIKCGSLRELPAIPRLEFLNPIGNADLEEWNMIDEGPISERGLNLTIDSCPKIRRLPDVRFKTLRIINCVGLRTLPPLKYPRFLTYLKLDTSDDGSLLSVISQTSSLEILELCNISKLTSLTELPHLPYLTDLRIYGCKDLQQLWDLSSLTAPNDLKHLSTLIIGNCTKLSDLLESKLPANLESLTISSCPNLKNLGADEMLKGLESLSTLDIENCQSLENLPNGGFGDKLQYLNIFKCPKIAARCQTETGDNSDWTKINKVKDISIDFTLESEDVVRSAGNKSETRIAARTSLVDSIRGCGITGIAIDKDELKKKLLLPLYLRQAMLVSIRAKSTSAGSFSASLADTDAQKAPEGPMVVFVNSKSGGRYGHVLKKRLQVLIGEEQVFDLSKVKPHQFVQYGLRCLEKLAEAGDLCARETRHKMRVMVAGGDGTVGWVLECLGELVVQGREPVPPVGIIPLGTRNDLSRSFGWGGSFPFAWRSAIKRSLQKAILRPVCRLDSWNVVMSTAANTKVETPYALKHTEDSTLDEGLEIDGEMPEKINIYSGVFYNYFSMGMDAKVAYGFHHLRNEKPYLAQGPITNKLIYSGYSCTQGWFFTPCVSKPGLRGMKNIIRMHVKKVNCSEWEEIHIPKSVRSIVTLNLHNYAGGRNPWGKLKPAYMEKKGFAEAHADDGLLEVIGLKQGWHASFVTEELITAKHLAQAAAIRFELRGGDWRNAYMQMDGEPWKQPIDREFSTIVEIKSAPHQSLVINGEE